MGSKYLVEVEFIDNGVYVSSDHQEFEDVVTACWYIDELFSMVTGTDDEDAIFTIFEMSGPDVSNILWRDIYYEDWQAGRGDFLYDELKRGLNYGER